MVPVRMESWGVFSVINAYPPEALTSNVTLCDVTGALNPPINRMIKKAASKSRITTKISKNFLRYACVAILYRTIRLGYDKLYSILSIT